TPHRAVQSRRREWRTHGSARFQGVVTRSSATVGRTEAGSLASERLEGVTLLIHVRALTLRLCHGRQQYTLIHSGSFEHQLFLRRVEMPCHCGSALFVQELHLILLDEEASARPTGEPDVPEVDSDQQRLANCVAARVAKIGAAARGKRETLVPRD